MWAISANGKGHGTAMKHIRKISGTPVRKAQDPAAILTLLGTIFTVLATLVPILSK